MDSPRTDPAAIWVVALAASAGGLVALTRILERLPADFPAAVVVVQHLDPRRPSQLAEILGRRTAMTVREAHQGDVVGPAVVFIAPPDYHLLVNRDGTLSLTQSGRVHFVRPSADLLFESLAASFGDRAVAVVLTGTGTDGASGVRDIKKMGGTVIAQDEGTSQHFGMPGAAIRTGSVDTILPLDEIAPALIGLVATGDRP